MELADCGYNNLIEQWHVNQNWQRDNRNTILICFKQISRAVKFIHDRSIIHRDLKPENVLVFKQGNQFTLKICDFGAARTMIKTAASTVTGTLNYMAPEMFSRKQECTFLSDIWSMGCLFFKICTGFEAFPGQQPIIDICKADYETDALLHKDVKEIIGKMIVLDPKQRLNDQELQMQLFPNGTDSQEGQGSKDDIQKLKNENKELKNNMNNIQNKYEQLQSENVLLQEEIKKLQNSPQKCSIKVSQNQLQSDVVSGKLSNLYCEYKQKYFDYEGEIKNGKAKGKGIAKYRDYFDAVYTGDFANNQRDGDGEMKFSDGEKYTGQFKNDKKQGLGIMYTATGDNYQGWFNDDKYDGYGIYIHKDGDVYEGQYRNGQKNGYGLYCYKNGDKYEGLGKNGEKSGIGIYHFKNGNVEYGEYLNNKPNGWHIFVYKDGKVEKDFWENGVKKVTKQLMEV